VRFAAITLSVASQQVFVFVVVVYFVFDSVRKLLDTLSRVSSFFFPSLYKQLNAACANLH
jgi:hypothetical protein